MKIRFLTFTLLLLIGIFTVACSSESSEDEEADETVTLSLWNRYPELNDTFQEFVNGFEEEHPSIKIDLQHIPVNSQHASYQSAVSEENLPDIWTTAVVSLHELVELDMAKNLNELFPEEVKDQYFPGTWYENGTTLNGDVYVYPLFSPNHGVNMMYYNKDVLDQHGISEDEIPVTWEEMMEVGKRIYEESDGSTYGFIFHNAPWAYNNFIYMQSTAISPETPWDMNFIEGRPDFANQGNIESIEFLKAMYDEGVMDPSSIEIDPPKSEANLAAGKAAFYIGGNWTGGNLVMAGFDNWGVAPEPTKDGEAIYATAARDANGLMVNNNTEHWEEIKLFFEYADEHIYEEVIFAAGTTQPARMDAEGEYAFSQLEDILTIMTDTAVPVPQPAGKSLDTIDFMVEYGARRSFDGIGDVAVGYLAGGVEDLEAELNKLDEEANDVFDNLLEETPEVSRELYQFPDWEPFTPYTQENYE